MAKTMEEFLRKEVLPAHNLLESKEPGLMPALMRKAGDLGLLAGGVPERYGGLALPKTALALLAEKAALDLSFAISIGVHSGVALLPLLYFGTPEQKEKYLPRLASGEHIAAFALSEANSGSDALGAQTRAALTPDGKTYRLNGAKMWTTNGGFADLFTVFVKVNGEQFTAFLVARDTPGLSVAGEEHKMGLHGSSTCRVLLQDAPVPMENVLGEVGKGHRPALYALNAGRFNIGATALGAAKESLRLAAQYAKQRVQFGQPISHFGLIRQKLAEMALRIFLLESMIYRIAGYWDAMVGRSEEAERLRAASEEYAIECALVKFFGTEVLDYVVDEALQIHGGFGYSEEFPIAPLYRDARVFRIFEGTNEINRLTVVDQLLRRARQGRLALLPAAAQAQETMPSASVEASDDPQETMGAWVRQMRAAILYVLGAAWETLGERLAERQEIAAALADMMAALLALESAWLRCRRLHSPSLSIALASVQVYGSSACAQTKERARALLATLGTGKALEARLHSLDRLMNPPLLDTLALQQQIGEAVVEREGYPC